MRRIPQLWSILATGLGLAVTSPALGQTEGPPAISQRAYTGGSIKVRVTGSFTIDAEIPINAKASYSDGEMTWLQFGASGAAEPNALITYNTESGETGINAAKGKPTATAGFFAGEKSGCSGKAVVTPTLITGDYTCLGVASYDPAKGLKGMGKVDIKVKFTAAS
ncbi:MAG: hypothetical protein ABIY46_18735 [Gemmatimonadales bacterium]